jgi:hypothetical protein
VRLAGKRNTFKIVVFSQISGEHIVVGEYVNLAEARKALREEKRKWKSGFFLVELAIPSSREREYEEEQRKLAKSRKPNRSVNSGISLRRVKIAIHFMPDFHENKVEPARPSRAESSRQGR